MPRNFRPKRGCGVVEEVLGSRLVALEAADNGGAEWRPRRGREKGREEKGGCRGMWGVGWCKKVVGVVGRWCR